MSELFGIAVGNKRLRTRLSFNIKSRFPDKLFDVVNDDYLLKWDYDGTSIVVEEKDFDVTVMKCYPGFVQIASFLNVRRLFREYSFDWQIVDGTESLFQFSHPAFMRGRVDLLHQVTTKRKSTRGVNFSRRSPFLQAAVLSSAKRYRKRRPHMGGAGNEVPRACQDTVPLWGRRVSVAGTDSSDSLVPAKSSSDSSQNASCYEGRAGCCTDVVEASACRRFYPSSSSSPHVPNSVDQSDPRPTRQDLLNVLAIYAQNELTAEEHLQLLQKTAFEEEQFWRNADSAREGISLQPALSLSSEEFVPFDRALQTPSFKQLWEESREYANFCDTASNLNHSNYSAYCLMPENPDINSGLSEDTEENAINEWNCQNATDQGLRAGEQEVCETERSGAVLWELEPCLSDQTTVPADWNHSQTL